MSLNYALPTSLEYFASLVQSDEHFPLFEAAAAIALDVYPRLDVQQLLDDMDVWTQRLGLRCAGDASALHRLRILNQYFFVDLAFGVNLNDFHDAENSYLHTVLRTRRGIPISLAVIWLEMANSIGLQARGVAFPSHFMVKVLLPQGQVVMDPLTGQSLSREELMERLEPYQPQSAEATSDSKGKGAMLGVHLRPASSRDIIGRMLRNLKTIHQQEQDTAALLGVWDRLIVLWPTAWKQWRDRGMLHAQLGNTEQAVNDLDMYLMHTENSADVAQVSDRLALLRSQLKA